MASLSMLPPGKSRKKKAPTLRESDWKPHQGRITELYTSGMPLKEVKDVIELETSFSAELRQYKSRISQWKLDKKVKPLEMQCIVRKRQKRKLVEVDKPEQIYEVRGNRVEEAKIDRWMNTHDVPDSMLYTPSPAASTPSAVGCRTISELGSPAARPDTARIPIDFFEAFFCTRAGHVRDHFDCVWAIDRELWKYWVGLTRPFIEPWALDALVARGQVVTNEFIQTLGPPKHIVSARGISHLFFLPTLFDASWDLDTLEPLVQYWLDIGLDIEGRDEHGLTPLLYAAGRGPPAYLSLLVRYGANVHAVDESGRGALHQVLGVLDMFFVPDGSMHDVSSLVLLLKAGCGPNVTDHSGRTPTQHVKEGSATWKAWMAALNQTQRRRMKDL